jgi:hypothetical protein
VHRLQSIRISSFPRNYNLSRRQTGHAF